MLRNIITYTSTFFAIFTFSATSAFSGGDEWKAKMIADAITAAPPAVTEDATIYAWDSNRQMILLRSGAGSYVCLASGLFSTRIGRPSLPYPDPMCLDQNAWKFLRHFLSQKNPMKPCNSLSDRTWTVLDASRNGCYRRYVRHWFRDEV